MSVPKIAGVWLVLTSLAATQDLPPEVLLLARIKAHMRSELSGLPNYTCLETISRFHRNAGQSALNPLDTVRLEIVYSDHHEWYGSPGDSNLGAGSPASFVGSGLIGSGAFASALNNILSGAHFVYQGEEALGDRAAVKYDFQFPRQPNTFSISMVGGSGTVGQKGSMWVDAQSLDLIRLETNADEIPPYLPLAAQSTFVNYARAQIGDKNALLAQQGDMRLVTSQGTENYDHMEFTHCRAFSAESAISFDPEPATATPAAAAIQPVPAISQFVPALLMVTVQLNTPVSSTDAVGKLIDGRVVGEVRYKGKALISDGARVTGRIRRLEHYQGKAGKEKSDFIVGLEFTEVETVGGRRPFYADLLKMDLAPNMRPTLSGEINAGEVKVTLPELPGVASFFVGGAAFTIPAGFKTVWRTRGPIRGK
jgi:hypothetical protein